MPDHSKYIQYIKNVGGIVDVEAFDDDWAPIGPMVRDDMAKARLVAIDGGKIRLYQDAEEINAGSD